MNGNHRLGTWLVAALLVGLAASPGRGSAQETRRTLSAGAFALELQGSPVGILRGAEGGDIVGDVVSTSSTGSLLNKHISSVKFSDFVLQVGANMESPVYDWIAAMWDGKYNRMSGSVAAMDYNFQVVARREFREALLTEVSLPALDAASKDPAYFTLRVTPESVRLVKGGGTIPSTSAAKQRPWLASSFRLEISGLDCTRVRRIEPFKVQSQAITTTGGKDPGAMKVGDLVVTLPESSADTWEAWAKSFLVDGQRGDEQEKSGDLVLLGSDLQSELARIHLSGLGIMSLAHGGGDSAGSMRNVVASLYCERATLEWKGGAAAVMNVRVFGR